MRTISILSIFVLIPLLSFAQNDEIGLSAGFATYQGDLVYSSFSMKGAAAAGGLFYKRHFSNKFAFRASANLGSFSGTDDNFRDKAGDRTFSFETNFFDASISAEYAFLGKNRYDDVGIFSKTFSPFVNIGLGYINVSPEVSSGTSPMSAEDQDFKKNHFFIPIGFGLKYDVSQKINIAVEAFTRTPFNDYLDGISVSANPDKNDWYVLGLVSFGYRVGGPKASGE